MNLIILLICILICVGCLCAAAVVKQKMSSNSDLTASETAFVGPVGTYLKTLGLAFFYRGLGFQPFNGNPRYRYYPNQYYNSGSSVGFQPYDFSQRYSYSPTRYFDSDSSSSRRRFSSSSSSSSSDGDFI